MEAVALKVGRVGGGGREQLHLVPAMLLYLEAPSEEMSEYRIFFLGAPKAVWSRSVNNMNMGKSK